MADQMSDREIAMRLMLAVMEKVAPINLFGKVEPGAEDWSFETLWKRIYSTVSK